MRIERSLASITYRNFAHLSQNHGRDFLRREQFRFLAGVDFNHWLRILLDHFEWKMFDVLLNCGITEFSTDQTFRIEDRI